MANRYLKQFNYTFEGDTVTVFGRFVVGSTGAVTSGSVKGGGVSGIVRNGTGDYTITFTDAYNKVLHFSAWLVGASGNSGIACVEPYDATPANFQSDTGTNKTIAVKTLDYAGAAADPLNTAYFYFRVTFRNSSVDPFGF